MAVVLILSISLPCFGMNWFYIKDSQEEYTLFASLTPGGRIAQTIKADSSYQLNAFTIFGYQIRTSVNGVPVNASWIKFKIVEGSYDGSVLADITINKPGFTTDQNGALYTFYTPDPVDITQDSTYTFIFESDGTSPNCIYLAIEPNIQDSYHYMSHEQGTGNWLQNTHQIYYDCLSGNTNITELPIVKTLSAKPAANNAYNLGGVIVNWGNATSATGYIRFGPSEAFGNDVQIGNLNRQSASQQFTYNVNNLPTNTLVYYQAYIVTNDIFVYGDVKQFTTNESNTGVIQTLKATDVKYTSATTGLLVPNLGSDTSAVVNIIYGTSADSLTIESPTVTLNAPDAQYYYLTGLSKNTAYYFQAKYVGDSGTFYGDILSFKTGDPDAPPIVNTINNIFGSWVWYIIAIIAIAVIWIFLHDSKLKQTIAVVLSFLVIGALLVMKAFDPWLIVLLAILAGVAIAGLIIKNRKSE